MNGTPIPDGQELWARLFALDPIKRRRLGKLLSRGEAADDPEVAAVAAALARWWLKDFLGSCVGEARGPILAARGAPCSSGAQMRFSATAQALGWGSP